VSRLAAVPARFGWVGAVVAVFWIPGLACSAGPPAGGAPVADASSGVPVSDCTVTLSPGTDIQPHIQPDAVICLGAGRYPGALRIEVPVTLQADAGAVLDAEGRGPVVHVAKNGIRVRLRGLTLSGGAADFGAGVLVDSYAEVALDDCALEGNERGRGGGAGLGAIRGRLLVRNLSAAADQDVVLDGVTEAAFESSTVAGSLSVRDGAKVAVRGGQVGRISLRGTTTRKPELVLDGVDTPPVDNHPTVPGLLRQTP